MSLSKADIDFYSLHGMWGAYASLALGRIGRGAGIVAGNVAPPGFSLFVGYKTGREEGRLLPFAPGGNRADDGIAYTAEPAAPPQRKGASWFSPSEITRTLSLGGEEWRAGALSFKVASFFGPVPDPAEVSPYLFRRHACPALLVRLRFDNSAGSEPMTGFFGMRGIRRTLSDTSGGRLAGMACGTEYGFAALPSETVEEVMDWNAVDAAFNGAVSLRRLAFEGGLRFHVEGGAVAEHVVALGAYQGGTVCSGIPMHRYYTCLFKDLEEVLEFALSEREHLLAGSAEMDALLDESPLDEDRKFLLAHAAHSYLANTELLLDEQGKAVFVVNEGEYQMMNTLDLTVDQAFWELCFSPWTLRSELDFILSRSMYKDAYGVAFSHDQGVADCFSPQGHSSYELPGLSACFSYMSYEETLNWVLSACLYVWNTGDESWAAGKADALAACLRSLRSRDLNGDGIMDQDSDRCEGGAEITTYDSLDVSLGQARNNLYLAVKAWGAFVCLESFFSGRGREQEAADAGRAAAAVAETVCSHFIEKEGFIPAVFEGGNRSRIIPAVEGLAYPYLCGVPRAVDEEGPYGKLIGLLKRHLDTVLAPGVCLDGSSGAWKLSSTSRNTWLSKIFLNQFVAERILGIGGERLRRDAVHASWLREGSADFAATDQVDASTGKDLGSRLYPRLVSSILWLLPHRALSGMRLPEKKE